MITTSNDKAGYPIPVATAPPRASDGARAQKIPEDLLASNLFLLKRLGDTVREQLMPAFVAAGCNPYHNAVLFLLGEGARDTQAEIADALGFDRSQLVGILDELEEEGLIERRRDANDRRRHVVTITPAGKRTVAKRRALVKQFEDEFLAPLDEKSRATLHELLLKVAGHHDERFAPG
jgi:MarR family transcriptional regulator, lower aerobic nicotinate degradation pathway regulator